MVRHLVAWSMSPGHEDELDQILDELRGLPGDIAEIRELSCGRLLNEADLDAALCVDVDDRDALARYRAHPAHQPVLERMRRTTSSIVVADYEL
ncbi:MAG TPA: Dabb family protein [Solirubrobacteraceae bacterium]|jgi:hypothetical protein